MRRAARCGRTTRGARRPVLRQTVRFDAVELAEVLRGDLAATVEAFLAADARIGRSAAPDDVHDARVALRRARSNLRTFRTLFDPSFLRKVRPEIAWAGEQFGPVRDLDVIASRLLVRFEDLDAHEIALLTTLLARERADGLRRLADARSSPRYGAALDALREVASSPAMRGRASREAAACLPALLERPRQELRAAGRAARARADADALHVLRIRTKQLRYAAELSAPVLGDPATNLASRCASLQRHLGRQRDATACAEWVTQHVAQLEGERDTCARLAREEHLAGVELAGGWGRRLRRVDRSWDRLRRTRRR